MTDKQKRETEWLEAKKKCRLSTEEVRMARELGLNPRSLIKNIPSPQQRWKAPVGVWVRQIYEKQKGATKNKPQKAQGSLHGPAPSPLERIPAHHPSTEPHGPDN